MDIGDVLLSKRFETGILILAKQRSKAGDVIAQPSSCIMTNLAKNMGEG
jgi:hypothetical protein